jgi:hypothetical protein
MLFELFWWIYTCPCKYIRPKYKRLKTKIDPIIELDAPRIVIENEMKECNDDDFFIIEDQDSLP